MILVIELLRQKEARKKASFCLGMRQTYGFSHRAGKMEYILAGCSFPLVALTHRPLGDMVCLL